MKVQILVLGNTTVTLEVPEGSTVGEALQAMEGQEDDFSTEGKKILVNGEGCALQRRLAEGERITLIPKVEGGGY